MTYFSTRSTLEIWFRLKDLCVTKKDFEIAIKDLERLDAIETLDYKGDERYKQKFNFEKILSNYIKERLNNGKT